MATSNETSKLTLAQCKAVTALLENRDVASAAKAAGIAERTLYRWVNENADFQAALLEAEASMLATVTRRLSHLSNIALDTLEEVMTGKNVIETAARTASRVSAARAVLDGLLRVREYRYVDELKERLIMLEAKGGSK